MVAEKGENKFFTKQFCIQLLPFLFVSLYNQHCLSGCVFRTAESQKETPKSNSTLTALRQFVKSQKCDRVNGFQVTNVACSIVGQWANWFLWENRK